MSVQCEVTAKQAAGAPMSVFERWLTLWVALCILVGIGLGQLFPGALPGPRAGWRSPRSICRSGC